MSKQTLVSKFKQDINGHEVLVVRGKLIPLFFMIDWWRFYDKDFKNKRGIYPILSVKKKDIFTMYIDLDEFLDVSREGIQNHLDNKLYIEEINIRYNEVKEKIAVLYEDYILNKYSNDEDLLLNLKQAVNYLNEIVHLTTFIDFLDSKTLEKTFVTNGFAFDFEKIYEVSSIYDFESFDLKNDLAILKWAKLNPSFLKYVFTGYSAVVTTQHVINKLAKIDLVALEKNIEETRQAIKERKIEKNKLRAKLNPDEQAAADFISWISEIRDDRKAFMNKTEVIMHHAITKLYENWGLTKDLAINSYVFEILKGKDFVLNNVDKLKARQNDFVCLYFGLDEYLEKYSDLDQEFAEALNLEAPRENVKEIKGQVVSKGYARGFAKVIHDPKKNHSFMEGEILVTSMTRPEFVPIMKKAAAVITNEGGITCHAAIISRELKKPCIVGTKFATEVIRDGDFIEVDADKGIIRILEEYVS